MSIKIECVLECGNHLGEGPVWDGRRATRPHRCLADARHDTLPPLPPARLEPEPPQPLGVKVSVRYVSATEQALIGGDAYDAVETDYGLRVLVADARGQRLCREREESGVRQRQLPL